MLSFKKLADTAVSAGSSAISYAASLLRTANDPNSKKKHRKITTLKANLTASLGLPDEKPKEKVLDKYKECCEIKEVKKDKEKKDEKDQKEIKVTKAEEKKEEKKSEPVSSTTYITNSFLSVVPVITSYFSKPATAPVVTPPVPAATPKALPKELPKAEIKKPTVKERKKERIKTVKKSQVMEEMVFLEARTKVHDTGSKAKEAIREEQELKEKERKRVSERKKTISKELELTTAEIDKLDLAKVELVEAEIIEHAARRVDLFFYLLIAVKGSRMLISSHDTVKQNGKGSKKSGTQACHSSFFPNLLLQPTNTWSWMLPTQLANTFFAETLNITTELPRIVNKFDCILEGGSKGSPCLATCVALLNRVSKDEIDIKQAMHEFFEAMHQFFTQYERDYLTENPQIKLAKRRVWECEKIGTFIAANQDRTLRNEYLYLMLHLSKDQISKYEWVQNTMPEWTGLGPMYLSSYCKQIQTEILAPYTPPAEKPRSTRRVG